MSCIPPSCHAVPARWVGHNLRGPSFYLSPHLLHKQGLSEEKPVEEEAQNGKDDSAVGAGNDDGNNGQGWSLEDDEDDENPTAEGWYMLHGRCT